MPGEVMVRLTKPADGSVGHAPAGEHPSGYPPYTTEGRMQVMLAFSGRERVSAPTWRRAGAAEP